MAYKIFLAIPTIILISAYLYTLPIAMNTYKAAAVIDPDHKAAVFIKTWLLMPWFLIKFKLSNRK